MKRFTLIAVLVMVVSAAWAAGGGGQPDRHQMPIPEFMITPWQVTVTSSVFLHLERRFDGRPESRDMLVSPETSRLVARAIAGGLRMPVLNPTEQSVKAWAEAVIALNDKSPRSRVTNKSTIVLNKKLRGR